MKPTAVITDPVIVALNGARQTAEHSPDEPITFLIDAIEELRKRLQEAYRRIEALNAHVHSVGSGFTTRTGPVIPRRRPTGF